MSTKKQKAEIKNQPWGVKETKKEIKEVKTSGRSRSVMTLGRTYFECGGDGLEDLPRYLRHTFLHYCMICRA
jgi:hypothetical protein